MQHAPREELEPQLQITTVGRHLPNLALSPPYSG